MCLVLKLWTSHLSRKGFVHSQALPCHARSFGLPKGGSIMASLGLLLWLLSGSPGWTSDRLGCQSQKERGIWSTSSHWAHVLWSQVQPTAGVFRGNGPCTAASCSEVWWHAVETFGLAGVPLRGTRDARWRVPWWHHQFDRSGWRKWRDAERWVSGFKFPAFFLPASN